MQLSYVINLHNNYNYNVYNDCMIDMRSMHTNLIGFQFFHLSAAIDWESSLPQTCNCFISFLLSTGPSIINKYLLSSLLKE